MSNEEFENVFKSFNGTVKKVTESFVEISFKNQTSIITTQCFSWNSEQSVEKLVPGADRVSPSKKNAVKTPNQMPSATPSRVMKNEIKDKNLVMSKKYQVKLSCVKLGSVPEFFVNFVEDEKEILEFHKHLNVYGNSTSTTSYSAKVNEVVCSRFSGDRSWYRGVVVEISKSGYKVSYIDYGNEDTVQGTDLRPLTPKFAVPRLCTGVVLKDVKNEHNSKIQDPKFYECVWTLEVSDASKSPALGMLYKGSQSLLDIVGNQFDHYKKNLKLQKLPKEGATDLYICYKNPEKLFLHQIKDVNLLETLATKLNSAEKPPLPKQVEVGMICCCLSSDKVWYRACVQKVSANNCKVLYVDYGNEEDVSVQNLKQLSNELFSYPVLCIPVFAQNSKEVQLLLEVPIKVEVVGERAGTQMVKLIGLPNVVKYPVLSSLKRCSLEQGSNKVVFSFCEQEFHFCCLSKTDAEFKEMMILLLNSSLEPLPQPAQPGDVVAAKSSDDCWYRASVESVLKDSYKVSFIDFGNSEVVGAECAKCLPKELERFPVFCIKVKIANIGDVRHRIDFVSEFPILQKEVLGSGVHVVEVDLPKLPKLNSLEKQVLPLNTPASVVVLYRENDIFYLSLADSSEAMKNLVAGLTEGSSFENLKYLPAVGDVLCAKFDDGAWYRASVLNVNKENKSCKVFFMDYGNSETVLLSNLKVIPDYLCSFPVLAIPTKFKDENALSQIQADVSVLTVRATGTVKDTQIIELVTSKEEESFEIEPLPDTPVEVTVIHKVDNVVYIQLVSKAKELLEMFVELQTSVTSLTDKPHVGQMLNIKFMEEYCRGVVSKVISLNKYEILFIDYGNTDIVDIKDMCVLPSKYMKVPAFSIPVVFLEGQDFMNSLSFNDQITILSTGKTEGRSVIVKQHGVSSSLDSQSNVKRYMRSCIEQRFLPVSQLKNVIFVHEDEDIFYLQDVDNKTLLAELQSSVVESVDLSGTRDCLVGELVCAQSQDNQWYRGCIEEVCQDHYKILFIDYGNFELVPKNKISQFSDVLCKFPILSTAVKVQGHEPAVKLPIVLEKLYSVTAESEPVNNVQLVKVVLQHEIPVNENELHDVTGGVMSDSATCVSVGKSIESRRKYFVYQWPSVEVSSGEQEIIIYYVDDFANAFWAPFNTKNIAENFELCQQIKEYCEGNKSSLYKKCDLPEEGEIVLAKYEDTWYRACVAESSSQSCTLLFIDFGNLEDVDWSNVRQMEPEFTSLPVQAFRSSFDGLVIEEDKLPIVVNEMRQFTIVSNPDALQAVVKDADSEYVINVPAIKKHLVDKNLVK